MSDNAMLLPFFTVTDTDMLRGESTRDALGLLPVWSKVGHELIPGLASIVTRIDGVQGILFLYSCMHALRDTRSKAIVNKILRFLERLWEYHLYQYREQSPCFGINSLHGAGFELSTSKPGTIGTGLRQYYRGTCVNKGIMSNDLIKLKEPYLGLCNQLLDKKVVSWLEKHVRKMDGRDYSIDASKAYQEIGDSLERFSQGSAQLWQALENDLVNDEQQMPWVEYLLETHTDWYELHTRDLILALQEYARSEQLSSLSRQCQNILDCEPFLQVVESAFSIAQEKPMASLLALSRRLSSTAPDDLMAVCQNFRNIRMPSKRLQSLQDMAGRMLQKDFLGFMTELLDGYYPMICRERGKSPIIRIDGDNVIAITPIDIQVNWAVSSRKWSNGYFIKTQISLYVDLMECRGGAYG